MASSGILRRVALVRTGVSVELSVSFIRESGIGDLGTLAVTSNRRTLRRNAKSLFTDHSDDSTDGASIDGTFVRDCKTGRAIWKQRN
jgi:hypothetical protein